MGSSAGERGNTGGSRAGGSDRADGGTRGHRGGSDNGTGGCARVVIAFLSGGSGSDDGRRSRCGRHSHDRRRCGDRSGTGATLGGVGCIGANNEGSDDEGKNVLDVHGAVEEVNGV